MLYSLIFVFSLLGIGFWSDLFPVIYVMFLVGLNIFLSDTRFADKEIKILLASFIVLGLLL